VLLLWIYYSGLNFYFGAEFTKSYADRYGSRLKWPAPQFPAISTDRGCFRPPGAVVFPVLEAPRTGWGSRR
jgi:hypothetical protein